MKLKSVEIVNFRGFDDKGSKIDLRTTPQKPLILFCGENGSGKSTIWEAINWVFFGKDLIANRIEDSKKQNKNWSLILSASPSYQKAKKNGKKTVELKVDVVIELNATEFEYNKSVFKNEENNNNTLRISRTSKIFFTETDNEVLWKFKEGTYQDNLKISQITDKGELPISTTSPSDNQFFLYNFTPHGIRDYYFFDAATENMATLASKKEGVALACRNLSGSTRANSIRELISYYMKNTVTKTSVNASEIKSLKDQIKDIDEDIEELKTSYREEMEKIQELKGDIKDLENQLGGIKKFKKEMKSFKQNKKNIINNKKKKVKFDYGFGLDFANNFQKIILKKQFELIKNSIEKEKNQGKWPKIISTVDIGAARRLEEQHGIGKEISKELKLKDTEGKKFVKKLFDKLEKFGSKESSSEGRDVDELDNNYYEFISQSDEIKLKTQNKHELGVDIQNEIDDDDKANVELFKIMKQTGKTLTEDEMSKALEMIENLEDYQEELGNREENAGKFKKRKENTETNVAPLKSKLAKLIKGSGESQSQIEQIALLTNLHEILDKQLKTFDDENRKAIEEEMEKIINKIYKKEKPFENVKINKDFSVDIEDGIDAGNQSRGQLVLLTVGFILSLIKVSNASPPLMVDATIAHVSKAYGVPLLKMFVEICDQSLHFLQTGREFHLDQNNAETNYLQEKASKIYTITKKTKESPIQVKEF
jgi:DNA sulfur modification protein DndD